MCAALGWQQVKQMNECDCLYLLCPCCQDKNTYSGRSKRRLGLFFRCRIVIFGFRFPSNGGKAFQKQSQYNLKKWSKIETQQKNSTHIPGITNRYQFGGKWNEHYQRTKRSFLTGDRIVVCECKRCAMHLPFTIFARVHSKTLIFEMKHKQVLGECCNCFTGCEGTKWVGVLLV